jgi:7-keto-8-aminopelargonate synthetase-like enzyme
MEDLERVLAKQKQVDVERKVKEIKNRRFIVVEGLYQSMGDLAPLAKIVELRHRVCLFLFDSPPLEPLHYLISFVC